MQTEACKVAVMILCGVAGDVLPAQRNASHQHTLLNVIVRQGPAILQLLASEDQTLLIRRDACSSNASRNQAEPRWCKAYDGGTLPFEA